MSDPLDLDPLLDPKLTGEPADGVAGDTVLPGAPGGAQGGEPAELTPEAAQNDLADESVDLEDGSGLQAGEAPAGDGAIETDDLSAIDFTASDDDPTTNELDIDEVPEGPL